MKRFTTELDKIASQVEKNGKLSEADRLVIAKLIDEVSDNLEALEKQGKWLMGDRDEASFMKRYDEAGAYISDEDEEYMKSFENPIEEQEVLNEYERKHKPGYEVRDLNTDRYKDASGDKKLAKLLKKLSKK